MWDLSKHHFQYAFVVVQVIMAMLTRELIIINQTYEWKDSINFKLYQTNSSEIKWIVK